MHRMTRSGGICKANAGGNLLQSSGCPEICDVRIPSGPSGQFPLCRPRGALGAFGFIRVTYIHNGSTNKKVHGKFTLLHKKYVVFANGENNESEEGIDKPPFGRYNISLGMTRRTKGYGGEDSA